MSFWKKSLMARLVSYFLLLSLVTVGLVGYVAYRQATDALKLSVFDRLSAVASMKEGELNRWVADEVRDVAFIARLPQVRAQARVLMSHNPSDPAYRSAYAALAAYLSAAAASKPDFQELLILSDAGGQIVVSTDRSDEGQYRISDRYFTQGRWGTFVQNVYPSPVTFKPTMTIATPLLDQAGRPLGVLAVHLNLRRMDQIVQERTGLGASNETYLVDRFNVFVSGEGYGRQDFPRGVHTQGIDAAVQGRDGAGLYLNYAGVPVIGVYRWIKERDLALLVEMHQDEAFAPARQLALTIFLIGLVSAGLLAVGVYLLARQIARPILAITRTAIQVAAGDLSRTAPVLTDDEVGVLARAFNKMTEQLRALYEGLEQKVSELKQTQDELVTYKDHLEDQVAARTAELQQAKEYFESLVRNSPVAIVTTDLDANVVSWNPAAEKLFRYAQAEALGRNIDHLVTTEDIRAEAVNYSRQTLSGDLVHTITRRARKDGTLVDVELLSVPVIVAGEQVGDIVIYHDITELQRARQEAEAANQAKSAFLATMSHEIRTPMNAIIGMGGLLLNTALTPEQQDYAEIIRHSADALLTIINDILDYSKIEAGKMELENAPFDLRDCLEAILDLLTTQAAHKGLDLAYLMDDGAPATIVGDVTRLRQILLNLLNNALKFTERGEVVLSVATRLLDGHRHELHFAVRDTGIGIPPDRINRLFQSFSQVDPSTTRKYGGTGLGLAISKRLSELMGGTMWVESEVGKGSTFHFTITAEAAPAVTTRADLRGVQPQVSGRRLLIVDDNATNRRIVVEHTRAWGMLVRDTALPTEALDWIRRGDPFDIAILDMMMPEMDGLMLAREIRTYRDARALPLVLFSSLGRREVGAEDVGFAAYLTKPLKPSHLFDALVSILAEPTAPVQKAVAAQWAPDPQMAERLPLRILLAEDNVVNQKLTLRQLRQMGYRADVAGNGLEAIAALERQLYDVVLMDVQMPEMDGLEAAQQICQRWPRVDRPRIIAMTANAMQGDREVCLEAGMDDYISKPIRVDELVGALSHCQPLERKEDVYG